MNEPTKTLKLSGNMVVIELDENREAIEPTNLDDAYPDESGLAGMKGMPGPSQVFMHAYSKEEHMAGIRTLAQNASFWKERAEAAEKAYAQIHSVLSTFRWNDEGSDIIQAPSRAKVAAALCNGYSNAYVHLTAARKEAGLL